MGTSVSPCLIVAAQVVKQREVRRAQQLPVARGLHSSTFQLNLSALYGIGAARRDCVAHVQGVLGGVGGV
jgi:hypothetical protein